MDPATELQDVWQDLTVEERARALEVVCRAEKLRKREHKDRVLAAEYVVDFNAKRAAARAGCRPETLQDPSVRKRVNELVETIERKCELNSEYVREYLIDILEFCPGDYFRIDGDGAWCIDQESYSELPRNVRRLVESIEQRDVWMGNTKKHYLVVKFIAKTAALRLAAACTVGSKVTTASVVLPWDEVARMASPDSNFRKLQQRMAEATPQVNDDERAELHADPDKHAVAGSDAVR